MVEQRDTVIPLLWYHLFLKKILAYWQNEVSTAYIFFNQWILKIQCLLHIFYKVWSLLIFPKYVNIIFKGGEKRMMKGYGYENVESKKPADQNSRFCIGSLTKAFTSTVMGQVLDDSGDEYVVLYIIYAVLSVCCNSLSVCCNSLSIEKGYVVLKMDVNATLKSLWSHCVNLSPSFTSPTLVLNRLLVIRYTASVRPNYLSPRKKKKLHAVYCI